MSPASRSAPSYGPQRPGLRLASLGLTEHERRDIADVATGVHTEGAAGFLLAHIKVLDEPRDRVIRFFHHIARYGSPALIPEVVGLAVAEKRPQAARLEL